MDFGCWLFYGAVGVGVAMALLFTAIVIGSARIASVLNEDEKRGLR